MSDYEKFLQEKVAAVRPVGRALGERRQPRRFDEATA